MKLKKIEVNKNGEVETVWVLSADQYYFLIHYAINDLINKGLVETEKLSEEDFKKLQEAALDEVKTQFLVGLDTKDLPQA